MEVIVIKSKILVHVPTERARHIQCPCMCNMKTQSIMVQKRWSRLKFFKSMSNVKVIVKSFGTN